jgi:hypothetical protein
MVILIYDADFLPMMIAAHMLRAVEYSSWFVLPFAGTHVRLLCSVLFNHSQFISNNKKVLVAIHQKQAPLASSTTRLFQQK